MKRCPQCEFIYEDEQTMCDMDGSTLAFDKSSQGVEDQRSTMKSFAAPAIAGTALAAVLFLAFYTSPLLMAKPDARQLSPAQTSPTNPVAAPTPAKPATAVPSPFASPEVTSEQTRADNAAQSERTSDLNHADAKPADSQLTIRRGVPPLPRVPSLPRLPPARVRKNSTVSPATTSQPKNPSKVESFLKKTGRVITRPFKF